MRHSAAASHSVFALTTDVLQLVARNDEGPDDESVDGQQSRTDSEEQRMQPVPPASPLHCGVHRSTATPSPTPTPAPAPHRTR